MYRFGQVGKLKPEKLPGVFCWKPSSAMSEGASCISKARETHQRLGFALPLYNRSALQFHTNDANRFGDQLNQQKNECLRGWLKAGRTPGPRRMLCCSRTSCAPPRDHHFIPRASLTLVLHHLPSGC